MSKGNEAIHDTLVHWFDIFERIVRNSLSIFLAPLRCRMNSDVDDIRFANQTQRLIHEKKVKVVHS